jgi:hypothetical protein
MTMLEFNNLHIDTKSELVWEWGYYISNFRSADKNTVLFSLGSFLAEVQYSLPENKLECIKGINSSDLPAAYSDHLQSDPFVQLVRYLDKGSHQQKI